MLNRTAAALDTPRAAIAIVAVLYGIFIGALWNARGRDISRFVVAGELGVDRSQLPEGLTVLPNSPGYDGLAFYRLALDPFTGKKVDYGISLDSPSYRHQRIGYPFIVWLLSGGKPALVPWLLVLVNYAALLTLAWAGALLAQHFQRHALWAIAIPLYPGFIHSISRDLAEPVACAFALLALLHYARRNYTLTAIFLCCGVLTRETILIVAAAIALTWFRTRVPVITFAAPIALYVLWQAILGLHWGIIPLQSGSQPLSLPFTEYAQVLYESRSFRRLHRLHFSQALYLGIVALLAVISWRRPTLPPIRPAYVLYLAVASTLPHGVWNEDVGYMRILGDFIVTSSLLLLPAGPRVRTIWLVCTCVIWYYLGAHSVEYS